MARFALLSLTALLIACSGASDEAGDPAAQVQAEAQSTYVCPMHPEVTSIDANATCSICGMDLVAAQAEDHAGHDH